MKLRDRGAMQQIDDPLPNLGQRRGHWRGLGSKDWVPRDTSGRVGAFIVGAIIVTFSLSMIASSFRLKAELQAMIPSPLVGLFVAFFAVMAVLCVAFWLLWYGARVLSGSFRRPSIGKQ
jgi:hypothetical protein